MSQTYAIVDVETTGTSPVFGRIIEIGILRVVNREVVKSFQSLVNPECYVHAAIQQLTGITNEELEGAPAFRDLAGTIATLLKGATFVAHNASFDYGFLRNEFARIGREFQAPTLCTMRLSRKLYPEYPRHDLSSLIVRHNLVCRNRHRALDDAQAVLEFLRHVWTYEEESRVNAVVRKTRRDARFPSHLDRSAFERLPEAPGVYLLYGKRGELLYVGKSTSIRTRVLSHFSANQRSAKELEMSQNVWSVEHRRTAGELGALLLESRLIKELRPVYNRAARRTQKVIFLRRVDTPEGCQGAELEEVETIRSTDSLSVLAVFRSTKQAHNQIRELARTHQLCLKLLGLERGKGPCFGYHLHQCHGACIGEEVPEVYNRRMEEAFAGRRVRTWPFRGPVVVEEHDRSTGAGEALIIDDWRLVGRALYNELGADMLDTNPVRFDYDTYKLLARFILNPNHRHRVRPCPDGLLRLLRLDHGSEPLFDDAAPPEFPRGIQASRRPRR
jgi:DNA polymerase-3 subunit epsilon